MIQTRKTSIVIFSTATLLLIVPFIAMFFTNQVKWDRMDFIVAGILLYGTAIACDFTLRRVGNRKYAFLLCGVIVLLLALVWAELAVGIF